MSRTARALVVPFAALLLAGCATRGWVNQIVGKQRVETDERVGKVEQRIDDEGRRIATVDSRIGEQGQRVEALGTQVKGVEEAANAARQDAVSARERADAAGTRADGAYARVTDTDERLTRLWNSRHKRSAVDVVRVNFGFDRFELDDGAQTMLLPVVDELKKNPALSVVLEGYTDPRGPRSYNLELSRRRVEAVRRYFVGRGVELWRINSIGLGPIDAANVAAAEKRRVTVTLVVAE